MDGDTGMTVNDYGTPVSVHKCADCGTAFTVCPAVPEDKRDQWERCLGESCASYDPARDADILFMTEEEVAKRKPVVDINMYRKRGICK